MKEPGIYPQFIGRLGNNLFQIAACIGYAKQHNVGWGIKKGYIEKGFNVNQVDKYFPHLPECRESFRRYTEPEFNYRQIPFFPQGVNIVGFFQSLKYFENAQDEVRDALKIKYVDGYQDHVAIHVRRGDYTQHPDNFPPITSEYVWNALAAIGRKLFRIPKAIVFSDDIEWCKHNLDLAGEVIYSEGRNEYEDLCLMASCGHNIIANSSFSWWGAFLNRNPDKVVVSPSYLTPNWFGEKGGVRDPKDLIPDNWIQIKFR
jgi:hypothetical protein